MLASTYTSTDHLALLPPIVLVLFACATLLLDVVGKQTGTQPELASGIRLERVGGHRVFVLASVVGHAREWRLRIDRCAKAL